MLPIRVILFGVSVSVLVSLATATHSQTVTKHMRQYSKSPIELPSEWHAWKQQHGKTYSSLKVELERHIIWWTNQQYIDAHNKYNTTFGYTLAMNGMGDLSEVEYQKQYSCIDYSSDNDSTHLDLHLYTPSDDVSLPEAVDWNTKNAVAPVKDQGDCCASYAFSTVGSVEGMEALASGQLTPLSEQNIIDCSGPYGNHGCVRGSVEKSLEYIVDRGINSQSVYPFQGITQKKCHYKSGQSSVTLRSYQVVKRGSENELTSAVAMQGPIAAGIDASHNTFRFYSSGVYDQPTCFSNQLNHAILIVGYGTDEHGKDYWLVKNSWGVTWGEEGYVRMTRNGNNQCGIATHAVFPTL